MSTPSTHTLLIRVEAVTVSPESPKRLTSGELHIGPRPHKHKLKCDDGTLRQQFLNVVELSPDTQITLCYNLNTPFKLFGWKKTQNVKIDARHLFESFSASQTQDLSVAQNGIRVTFSCRATETDLPAIRTTEGLTPTTQAILEDCPQFRILVIGKSGVGKSSLIKAAFGISEACSSDLERGKADIKEGLQSPINERFILHDSVGFEPGDKDNYETVKDFIQSGQTGKLKDQLHAVWFCVQIPLAEGRLLEVAAEDFFRTKQETMGAIPLIVVYTRFDSFVDQLTMALMASHGEPDEESLTKDARSKAESRVREWHNEITQLAGESPPYEFVSTKEKYKHTVQNLVQITQHQVGIRDSPEAPITSIVTSMAQRVIPHLKIQGSIDVGKRRYWKALGASLNFKGHTIWDCLSVIHIDIVNVWNFIDPAGHLLDSKFKELVIKMVQEVEMRFVPNPDSFLDSRSVSRVNTASSLLAAVSNAAAPIVLPVIAGVAAAWRNDVYQNMKNEQIFMAFIVDLTHIMELLFILTSRDHNKLTRRAIKFAYSTYYTSDAKKQAHAAIQTYRDVDGRDAALDMIKSLIDPERSGGWNLNVEVSASDMQKMNLNQEEEW